MLEKSMIEKNLKPAGSIQYPASAFVNRLQTTFPLTNPSAKKEIVACYSKEATPCSL